MEQRGYWRESGERVSAEEAWDVWASHAYEILVGVARSYHEIITYKNLGEQVQARSGIRTSALLHNWIGPVLGRVVREANRRGDPPLTALVVHTDDGKVGVGYKEVLQVAGEPAVEDEMERERHAAAARLTCYRHFDAVGLPPDGGRIAFAPKLKAAVARQRARAPEPRRPLCPTCRLQLPATGVCDSCA
ncbi:hypothetical protein NCC78_19660 [Micromonospora phytophila]|uniref:hypothetical protein n=1 Tax=Micromonospora phytophila TaxID=709888 RepID=UPI00202F11ED|nr:hypothetical protein [Micromonospora phytophila]MCM0676886.1 hypothetical protein [Micromonospora phytophila]